MPSILLITFVSSPQISHANGPPSRRLDYRRRPSHTVADVTFPFLCTYALPSNLIQMGKRSLGTKPQRFFTFPIAGGGEPVKPILVNRFHGAAMCTQYMYALKISHQIQAQQSSQPQVHTGPDKPRNHNGTEPASILFNPHASLPANTPTASHTHIHTPLPHPSNKSPLFMRTYRRLHAHLPSSIVA